MYNFYQIKKKDNNLIKLSEKNRVFYQFYIKIDNNYRSSCIYCYKNLSTQSDLDKFDKIVIKQFYDSSPDINLSNKMVDIINEKINYGQCCDHVRIIGEDKYIPEYYHPSYTENTGKKRVYAYTLDHFTSRLYPMFLRYGTDLYCCKVELTPESVIYQLDDSFYEARELFNLNENLTRGMSWVKDICIFDNSILHDLINITEQKFITVEEEPLQLIFQNPTPFDMRNIFLKYPDLICYTNNQINDKLNDNFKNINSFLSKYISWDIFDKSFVDEFINKNSSYINAVIAFCHNPIDRSVLEYIIMKIDDVKILHNIFISSNSNLISITSDVQFLRKKFLVMNHLSFFVLNMVNSRVPITVILSDEFFRELIIKNNNHLPSLIEFNSEIKNKVGEILNIEEISYILTKHPDYLKYIPENIQTYESCMNCVMKDPSTIAYVAKSFHTSSIIGEAIRRNHKLINTIPIEELTYDHYLTACRLSYDIGIFNHIPQYMLCNELYEEFYLKNIRSDTISSSIIQVDGSVTYCSDNKCLFFSIPKRFRTIMIVKHFIKTELSPILEYEPYKNGPKDIFNEIEIEFLDDLMIKEIINFRPLNIKTLPFERITQEICDYAFSITPIAFKFIPHQFQTYEMVAILVNKGIFGNYIDLTNPNLITEKELIEAIHGNPEIFKKIKVQTPSICQVAIQKMPKLLEYVIDQTDDLCEMALKEDPCCYRLIRDKTNFRSLKTSTGFYIYYRIGSQDIIEHLKKDPFSISRMNEQPPELCEIAIRANPATIKFIHNPTIEQTILAVSKNGLLLKYIKEQPTNICLVALTNDVRSFQYIINKTELIWSYAIALKPSLIRLRSPEPTVEYMKLCMNAVTLDPRMICYCVLQFDDLIDINLDNMIHDIYQTAVMKCADTLKFIPSHYLEFNYQWISIALEKDPNALKYVPENLQTEEIIKMAVTGHGSAIKYASFVNNEIYEIALKTEPMASILLTPEMKSFLHISP